MISVLPTRDRGHAIGEDTCWCEPQVYWLDPESHMPYANGPIVSHNARNGYADGPGQWCLIVTDAANRKESTDGK